MWGYLGLAADGGVCAGVLRGATGSGRAGKVLEAAEKRGTVDVSEWQGGVVGVEAVEGAAEAVEGAASGAGRAPPSCALAFITAAPTQPPPQHHKGLT